MAHTVLTVRKPVNASMAASARRKMGRARASRDGKAISARNARAPRTNGAEGATRTVSVTLILRTCEYNY